MSTFRTNDGRTVKDTLAGIDNSPYVGKRRNISAQAHMALIGEDLDAHRSETYITALNVIEDIALVGSVVGAGTSAAKLTEVALEKACTPTNESLGKAIDSMQRKNLAQDGFNLWVRVKYEEYVSGIFRNGWEEKFSNWKEWEHDGMDLKGFFQAPEDVSKATVSRAMKWRMELFLKEKI